MCGFCPSISFGKIYTFLDGLVMKKNIMFKEGDRYLALAVKVH